jgi:hypothetical protein
MVVMRAGKFGWDEGMVVVVVVEWMTDFKYRRRKVRCNERRPRCGHCERLNLDCTWNRPIAVRNNIAPSSSSSSAKSQPQLHATSSPQSAVHSHTQYNQSLQPFEGFGMNGNSFFDFSCPLGIGTWDEAMLLSPNSWPSESTTQMEMVPQSVHQFPIGHPYAVPHPPPSRGHAGSSSITSTMPEHSTQQQDLNSTSPFSPDGQSYVSGDDEYLTNTFLQMLMPPILTPVEIGPKWASTRAFFASMAAESTMVRSAIMAFAAMQMQRSGLGNELRRDWRPLYEGASRQLSSALAKRQAEGEIKDSLKYILASIFLLTYTDVSPST